MCPMKGYSQDMTGIGVQTTQNGNIFGGWMGGSSAIDIVRRIFVGDAGQQAPKCCDPIQTFVAPTQAPCECLVAKPRRYGGPSLLVSGCVA